MLAINIITLVTNIIMNMTRGPPETGLPECRLCEEFPVFQKNFDFHKHLVDAHFRIQINSELPQVRKRIKARKLFGRRNILCKCTLFL